jgi:hypothetical protein
MTRLNAWIEAAILILTLGVALGFILTHYMWWTP